jgi:Flp pilus assembly protein TadD
MKRPRTSAADSPAELAVYHLTRAVQIYPGRGIAWGLLGDAYASVLGAQLEAVRCCEKLTKLSPRDARGHRELGTATAIAGDFGRSIRAYRSVLALDPSKSDAWYGIDLAYEGWGYVDSPMYA